MFKKIFTSIFIPTWLLVIAIACILALPRFYWMLEGKYNTIVWIFLVMMALPFLLLSKSGRRQIGFTKPVSWLRMLAAFGIGGLGAVLVYAIGAVLYGVTSPLHWYVAIQATFMQRGDMIAAVHANPSLFLVFALPAMMFSPLGEEFFFRGIFHEALAERFGNGVALFTDAVVFGLTHIAHYGLVMQGGTLTLLFPSVLWWVLLMAATSLLFSFVRVYAGTLWAATLCHAGFNLTMMWCIFFALG
jgi:uncharacterized protein